MELCQLETTERCGIIGNARFDPGDDFVKRRDSIVSRERRVEIVRPTVQRGNYSFIESRETRTDIVDDISRRARSGTRAIETLLSRPSTRISHHLLLDLAPVLFRKKEAVGDLI